MRFYADVVETQVIERTYVIEADSPEEARAKAEIGDTVEEWDGSRYPDVTDREVFDVTMDY